MCAKQTKKTKTKKTSAKPKVTKRPKKKEVHKKEKVEERVEEKVVERKELSETFTPAGIPPRPMVGVRHEGSMMEREARGYSWGELSEAGIETASARRWKVQVDLRRRSTINGNVERLKGWLQPGEVVRPSSVRKTGPGKKK